MTIDPKLMLNVSWLGSAVLLMVAIGLFYVRRLHRQFPWFFRYLLFVLGRSPVLFLLKRDRTVYFYGYWLLEAITVGFSLLVIYEIYRYVLNTSSLSITRSRFFSLTVALLVVAVLTVLTLEYADTPVILRTIFVLTNTVRIVQVGLLAILLALSLFFGFYWQSLPFGFALGYGVYATVELVAAAFRSSLGPSGDTIFALSKVFAYQLAVMIWIGFIWKHRAGAPLGMMPNESLTEWSRPLEGHR